MKHAMIRLTLIAAAATVAAPFTEAAPRKYTRCAIAGQIQTPPGSAGFHMSEDCATAYVLPPEAGTISMASYVDEIGASGEMCGGVSGTVRSMGERRAWIERERGQLDDRTREIADQLTQNGKRCLSVENSAATAETRLKSNRDAQVALMAQLQQLDAEIAACASSPPSACAGKRDQRPILQDRLDLLKINEESLIPTVERLAERRDRCHGERQRTERTLNEEAGRIQARTEVLNADLREIVRQTTALYEAGRTAPGAQMSVVVASGQIELTKRFRELNASLKGVQFVEMPLNDVSLSFTQITDGVASGYPVLLKAHINGVSVRADNSMIALPFSTDASSNQSVVFGAAVGGSLTINRFAACQLPPAEEYGHSGPALARRLRDIAGLVSATATYRYQLGVSRKIRIRYNEKQLYCLIRKQSSRSGLFSSSSSSSITESSHASQWLSIDVSSEDTGFDFADRDTLLLDLRSEMLDRALMKVATSYLSRERAALVAPGEPRAGAISSKLDKCPHLYCQVASVALDLGSALFGGTSSSSSTCEDVGASSDQDYVDTKPVSAYGTQAFKVKAGGAR